MTKEENAEISLEEWKKLALSNQFYIQALFELLAEKGIVTREEVLGRAGDLMREGSPKFHWLQ